MAERNAQRRSVFSGRRFKVAKPDNPEPGQIGRTVLDALFEYAQSMPPGQHPASDRRNTGIAKRVLGGGGCAWGRQHIRPGQAARNPVPALTQSLGMREERLDIPEPGCGSKQHMLNMNIDFRANRAGRPAEAIQCDADTALNRVFDRDDAIKRIFGCNIHENLRYRPGGSDVGLRPEMREGGDMTVGCFRSQAADAGWVSVPIGGGCC